MVSYGAQTDWENKGTPSSREAGAGRSCQACPVCRMPSPAVACHLLLPTNWTVFSNE